MAKAFDPYSILEEYDIKSLGGVKSVNTIDLKPMGKEPNAPIAYVGDVHYGSPNCRLADFLDVMEFLYKNNIGVFTMGDMLECGTRTSVGDSVYTQASMDKQLDFLWEVLSPFADKGLLLGMLDGNHEERISKAAGIDITKQVFAKRLGVPYLGSAGWNLIRVGGNVYKNYVIHGRSGSRYIGTKLNALKKVSDHLNGDVVCMGHMHDLIHEKVVTLSVNTRNRTREEEEKHLVVTGHFLDHKHSYAETYGLPPANMGCPIIRYGGETGKKSIEVEFIEVK